MSKSEEGQYMNVNSDAKTLKNTLVPLKYIQQYIKKDNAS